MSIGLKALAISVLLGSPYAQAKKFHDSQIDGAHSKLVEPSYRYQGNVDYQNSKKYQFFLNLEALEYFPPYDDSGERRIEMNSEHLDVIWDKLTNDFPKGTRFSIAKASTVGKVSTVEVYMDSSVSEQSFPIGDFFTSFRKGEFVNFGVEPRTEPQLYGYVDLEKWDKETAFNLTQKYLLESHPVVRVTIVFEASLEERNADSEYYEAVLNRAGTNASKQDIVRLSEGLLAVQVLADINVLQSLFDEQKIINIIPDLPEELN